MTTAARSYRWLFWTLAVIGLAVDQTSKYFLFRELYNDGAGGRIVVIPDAFFLDVPQSSSALVPQDWLRPVRAWSGERMPTVNHGALFGLGQDMNVVFAAVSIFAAIVVLYWQSRPHSGRDPFLCVALGLILAGTLGNLYDRLVFGGVRDFLHWTKWYDWYVFNIADVCLVCGASMLVLEALFAQPKTAPAEGDADYANAASPSAGVSGGATAAKGVAVTTTAD
jgi:lipoprotein signal peptidase